MVKCSLKVDSMKIKNQAKGLRKWKAMRKIRKCLNSKKMRTMNQQINPHNNKEKNRKNKTIKKLKKRDQRLKNDFV